MGDISRLWQWSYLTLLFTAWGWSPWVESEATLSSEAVKNCSSSFCLLRLVKSSLDSKDYQNWQIMVWEYMFGLDSQGLYSYFFVAGFFCQGFQGMGLQGFYQPGFQGMGVGVNKSFKDTPPEVFSSEFTPEEWDVWKTIPPLGMVNFQLPGSSWKGWPG